MATAATSTASLDSAQRAWLKKMGAALDAPVSDDGAAASKREFAAGFGPGDIIDPLKKLTEPRSCQVRVVNETGQALKLDPLSVREVDEENQIGISHGKYDSMPPDSLAANNSGEFKASSNTVLGQTLTGVEGRVRYFLDDQKTAWILHFDNPFAGSNDADVLLDGPNKDQFESPKPSAGSGNDAVYLFTLRKKGGGPEPKPPGPTPGTVDAASSCHVTVTNDTQVVLTFGGSGHERGNFMTPPAKSLKPGDSTTFVSVEVPNNSDKKEEGCKGHVLWQVGSPNTLWRIEWDNPEQQQNVVSHSFNPPNAGFVSANFIGQGEENVPVSFTISGGGTGPTPPPPGTGGKVEFTVIDAEADATLEGATIQAAGQSAKTGAAGTAEMELPAGSQAYVVTADGFEDNKGTVEVASGEDVDRVVFMKKGTAKGGKVTFLVIDAAADKVLEGATIEAAGKSAKTGAGGTAEMELPEGTQAYVVTADGYDDNKGTIEITSGQDSKRTVFMNKCAPTKGSKITFKVLDTDEKKPIDNATVEAAGKSAKTAGGGAAVLELPAGTQTYVVKADGFEDNNGTVEVVEGKDGEQVVLMKRKPPTGSKTKVKFTVTDKESSAPIAGATIKLGTQTGQTDSTGVSTLEVEPGSLSYVVQKEEYQDATGKVDAKPDTQTDQAVQLEKEPSFNPPPESKQPTLRKGDKSADGWVEYLQKLLNKYLGKGTVPEDGVFDQRTYDAVKKFQASTKPPCLVDGIVGNETWSMLRKGEREKVGVNEQDDEKGAEGRWATEKNDFVTYDAASDELRMIAFSVGDAPIDKYKATFRITSADKKVEKVFERVIGAPTGPSPTGSGHMHVVKVEQMAATYGNGDVSVEAYLEEILGGDLWKGTVKVSGTGPSTKTGDIGFTVTDEKTGSAVPGASVSLAGQAKSTDSAGVALFEKAPAGKQPFAVTHPSYEPASGEAEVLADASTAKVVKLKPKSPPPPTGTSTVGFVVTDKATGKPVSGATVTMAGESKTTDGAGIATFEEVAGNASYPYTVSHPSYKTASSGVEVDANTSKSEQVKLEPQTTPPPSGTSTVGFVVTDKVTGKPVSGATVTMAGESKTTDGAGIATFEKVAGNASYPYTVSHPSYKTASSGVEVDANTSKSEQVKLEPAAGPSTGGSVGFIVTDESTGNLITGATVSVAGQSKTTAMGVATFDDIAPGSYSYTVTHPSYELGRGGVDIEENANVSEELKLKPKAKPPGGAVGFTVTDKATGKPISGATAKVANRTATTDGSGNAKLDDIAPGSYAYNITHPSYEAASGGVDVEAQMTSFTSVQLQPKPADKPTPDVPDDGAPPEHRLVTKKTYTHKVNLKDTNYRNEELGHWLLRMEVGLSGTGQVYPLHIDLIPKLVNPANNIINIFPTIKAKSENLNGARSCDITFNVQVAGPNVTSSSGGKVGGSIGWKDEVSKLEAGLSAEWTISESHNSQAGGAWSRRFHISGGDVLGFSQDNAWKEDLSGEMVIDDDHGHDQWGVDTDWELHTYDG